MNVRALTETGLTDVWRSGPAVAASIGVVALGLLFHTEVATAVHVWSTSTAYNHCFLVIPIVLYLLWDRREVLHDAIANPMPMAALAGIPLAMVWFVAERLGIMEGRQLIAMSFVELLFFIVLGSRLWWQLAGPLLYLYFLVPFGAFLTRPLQDITTIFVDHGLRILHIPAYITGYTIEIPEGTFLIAEACAGLRFLIAAVAFGCLYALIMYRGWLRRTVFIAVSLVVPVIANGFRALGIITLGHLLGSAQAVEADHILYGWIFFSIVILILIALGLPFRQDQPVPASQHPRRMPDWNYFRPAMYGTAALVLLAAISPTVADALDRTAVPDMASALPLLEPTSDCKAEPAPPTEGLGAPGRTVVQRFDCGQGVLTLTLEVFSPRSPTSQLLAERRRLTDMGVAEDVQSTPLNLPNAPRGAWQMIEAAEATHVAAASLWIEGEPAQLGLTGRVQQAWRSIVGSQWAPVLVVVRAKRDPRLPDLVGRRQAAVDVETFLRSQPQLARLIATAGAAVAPVKD
jgi:exosortase A